MGNIILGILKVVAFQYLLAFESPHLDGSQLSVAGVPKVGSRYIIGSYARGEIYSSIFSVFVAIDVANPSCSIAIASCSCASDEFGEAEVV